MNDEEFDDVDPSLSSPSQELEGGELTKESKPAVKKPSAQEPKPSEPAKEELPPGERAKTKQENLEEIYPGITEQIRRFVEADLPSCSHCGSEDTASVQVGAVGRAAVIADATKKVKLVPNAKDKLGTYFCNACGKYFN